ncbi:MAG TPA: DegT/DnrJ/EryC1/StrS aminotransferase family protein [Patescibacteria group bacterium]
MKKKLPAIIGGKPQRKKYLTFGSPFIGKEEINEVVSSLKSGWISTGPKVAQFEKDLAKFIEIKHIKALSSCTAAIHLALIAAGVGKDDEVITSPLTFAATANTILHVGAKPIFVDCKIDGNIDEDKIEEKITKKTKAILPIHLYGRPCNMDKIGRIAKKYHLLVIEDAAHALGASIGKKNIGTISEFTCFSFYVTKNLATGEGGALTTKKKSWRDLIEKYSLHGMNKDAWKRYSSSGYSHYQIEVPGFKYNLMDIQAAMGIHQLRKFNAMQKRRNEIWSMYDKAFKNLPVIIPPKEGKGIIHAHHLYTVLIDLKKIKVDRDTILQALHKEGIGVGVHFISLHLHPLYKRIFKFKKNDFPNALLISERTISLPISAKLTNKDVYDVIQAVKKIINYYSK